MCGIAAILARPGTVIGRALPALFDRQLAHRGPDASGFATFNRAGEVCETNHAELALIHRRLSIIDLDPRANQPMASRDGKYVLIFNGEIYNYLELREELQRKGEKFFTASDSEVLIAAYAAWGEGALSRFTGMFAFVLLDKQRRELFLARDPFGIKPLFWAMGSGALAIASEIGPLLDVPGVGRRADLARTALYLSAGETDAGERTMFAAVRSLPAGSYAHVSLNSVAEPMPVKYWQQRSAPRQRPFAEAAQELREAFLDSIKLHLRSDVALGVALSGGIDSSAILCAARQVAPTLPIRTFSFTAAGSEVDETPYIDIVAEHIGAASERVRIEPADIARDIDGLVKTQGEPFGSLSIYAQYRVMALAKNHGIKVMLDGQGADELFAGYRPFLARRLGELIAKFQFGAAMRLLQNMRRLPGAGTLLLAQAFEPAVPKGLRAFARKVLGRPLFPDWFDERWLAGLNAVAVEKEAPRNLHGALMQSLTETVLPALLRYEDRNSMAFSIESRVPFLTPALADLAYSMPADYLVDEKATSKSVLRAALRDIVPDAILDRRDKIGFATPDRMWASALQPWFLRVLKSDVARSLPWLKADRAVAALNRRVEGSTVFGFDFWRTVNLVRWIECFNVEAS